MKHARDFHSQSWNNPFFNRERSALLGTVVVIVFVLALAAGLFYAIFWSPLLRIGKIEITGNPEHNEVRIKAATLQAMAGQTLFIIPNDHFFFASPAAIRSSVLVAFPQLKNVSVTKSLDRINISIEEKTPSLRLLIGDKAYLLDQDGLGLREAKSGEGDRLVAVRNDGAVFVGKKQLIDPNWLLVIFDLHKYFATQVGVRDSLMRLDQDNGTIALVTIEGWYVVFDPTGSVSDQLTTLRSAIYGKFGPADRAKLDYIDARFGDKVFYKWK